MHLESSVVVDGNPEELLRLVEDIAAWPAMLPHYRYVHVLRERPGQRLADMAAWRGWVPVRWQAEQEIDINRQIIRFKHTRGITKGMDVVWSFLPDSRSRENSTLTEIRITHELESQVPSLIRPLVNFVVGRIFIDYIAGRTLRRVKELAETASLVRTTVAGS